MKKIALLGPALCLALAACDQSPLSVVCAPDPAPAVLVAVFDPASGEPVTAQARGWWTAAGMTDSLRHVAGGSQLAAYGPPGVYEVRIHRPGHAEWLRTGLQVQEGACGPATQRVTAVMQPVSISGGQ